MPMHMRTLWSEGTEDRKNKKDAKKKKGVEKEA